LLLFSFLRKASLGQAEKCKNSLQPKNLLKKIISYFFHKFLLTSTLENPGKLAGYIGT